MDPIMADRERISDVFKAIGQPTVTYVQRDSGKLEKLLRSSLNEKGQLCLVTGPSKTGKTTLYREVLSARGQIPLIVQCDHKTTCDSIWKKSLELVDFDRAESISTNQTIKNSIDGEISSRLGWGWLANVSTRLKGTVGSDAAEGEIRKRVLSDPGPDLLIPILSNTNYVLVIEDFHYLEDEQKKLLFQQWKRFIDNEVSVIVLGTTHRAVDIANSNRDIVGRIAQIDVGHWELEDLAEICRKGFRHLGIKCSSDLISIIAAEAVGLPIVVQQVCHNIFDSRGIEYTSKVDAKKFLLTRENVESCLHNVAKLKYTQFETYYGTLIRGPREKSRKYKTYELVLACFTLDPIKFSLKRVEIDSRMAKLELAEGQFPPAASLNSTLGALKKFQLRRGFELLEWRPNEEILYIIEPTFLFYVRWRTRRASTPEQLDLFERLISRTWAAEGSEGGTKERKWRSVLFNDIFNSLKIHDGESNGS